MLRLAVSRVAPAGARTLADASQGALKRTALYDLHLAKGAKMVPYAGWEMPLQYKNGVIAEHNHVRSAAGLFDVAHMLQFTLDGPKAADFLETIVPTGVSKIAENTGSLTVFTNHAGGIIDDAIINITKNRGIRVVSNAGCADKVLAHVKEQLPNFPGVTANVITDETLVALQGPKAMAALQKLTPLNLTTFQYMNNTRTTVAGIENVSIVRCGYTGEDGFEISLPTKHAANIVEEFLRNDTVQLAGLAARDSLRLDAGLCLYGNDIDEGTSPVAARYTWCIDKTKTNYVGASVIVPTLPNKTNVYRVGLSTVGRAARHGCKIFDAAGKQVGLVTSGGQSPTLKKSISMGYVDRALSKSGTQLFVEINNKKQPCVIEKLPFIVCNYYKPQL